MSEEPDQNEALWAAFKDHPIIRLPLIAKIPTGHMERPFPVDPTVEPTIGVQMNSLGGKRFLLSLTVDAARKLIFSLALQLELAGCELDEPGPDKPRTIHSHVRPYKMQASEFVASLEALHSGSAGQGRGRGRRDDD